MRLHTRPCFPIIAVASALFVTSVVPCRSVRAEPRAADDRAVPDAASIASASLVTPLQWGQVERQPYPNWKEHTGPAETAVVHVRATFTDPETGDKQVREGSGFVIRCDGFVLVPSQLLVPWVRAFPNGTPRRTGVKDKEIVLTFAGADGPVPAPQIVPLPRHFLPAQSPYAAAKVNGQHLRGLPMLAATPGNVHPGQAVRLVYARLSKEKPGQAEAVTVAAAVGERETGGEGDRFRFAVGTGSAALPRVPAGTVVVDTASGFAIGIVPSEAPPGQGERALLERATDPVIRVGGAEPASGFVTFARLYDVCNAIGLRPGAPDVAAAAVAPSTGLSATGGDEDMVWVPGGPTAMPYRWTSDYAMLWNYWITCTPGFFIRPLAKV